jgi:mono/diheme cytochrome c family protein
MRNLIRVGAIAIALVIVVGGGGLIFLKTRANGFSARAQPTALERWAARQARAMAIQADARERSNPAADPPEVQGDARAHWADHCAICHANSGSGDTEIGRHMYPPAPDMRQADTQNLTDGELFFIIQNGIRLTGMPSWGSGTSRDEEDSWKLVRLIRHLPKLTAEEEREMQEMNPKSPEEMKEEQQERDFLNGVQSHEQTKPKHH